MKYRALVRSVVCVTMATSLSACLGGPVAGFDRPGAVTAVPAAADPTPVAVTAEEPAVTPDEQPAACVASDEVCDGVDNDCDGRVDELDRCHAPELVCATAPSLGDPSRLAWTTELRSDALVVASSDVGLAGEAPRPAVYYRVTLTEDSLLAVRSARPVAVLADACATARAQTAVASQGCGDERIELFALDKGEYTLRFEGARTDAVDATVQAMPLPDRATGYHLRTWDELSERFYLSAAANDPDARWSPPCGAGPRPWSVEAVYGCVAPSAVRVEVSGSPALRLASVQGDDAAVCVSPGTAELAVSPRDIVHRFVVSAAAGGYGGLWVTASAR